MEKTLYKVGSVLVLFVGFIFSFNVTIGMSGLSDLWQSRAFDLIGGVVMLTFTTIMATYLWGEGEK